MIKKKVVYKILCPCKRKEVFEMTFEIEEGSENVATEVQAYCPFCDQEEMTVTVQGKVVPDEELLRKYGIHPKPGKP